MQSFPKVSIAPCKEMYYIWNSEKTLFVVAGDTTKNAFSLTKKYYKDNIQPSIEEWRLLTLPLGIRNAPQTVVDYFVSNIIMNLKKETFISQSIYLTSKIMKIFKF